MKRCQMRRLLLFIGILFLFAFPLSAAWVPAAVQEVHEGEQLNIGGILIKVLIIDAQEKFVSLELKQNGRSLGRKDVFLGEGVLINNLFRISIDSFSPLISYGNQATLRFESAAEGKILYTNFPNALNYNDIYTVFVVIENTGLVEATYLVELTEPGDFERWGKIYRTPEGKTINELVKVDRPLKFVTVPAGSLARVEWLIGPNKRFSSYTRTYDKTGKVQFNLYAGETILDSVDLSGIKVSKEQSGYISEMSTPPTMIVDVSYDVYAKVQNAGYATTGTNSQKFGIKVITAGFEMDPKALYDEINPGTKTEWSFRMKAYKPGQHLVTFQLVFNDPFTFTERVLDDFIVPITVLEGYSTRISEITLPDEITLGDQFPVKVMLENLGKTRHIDVVLEAPALLEIPLQRRALLPSQSLIPLTFTLEATTYGKVPITVTLYEEQTSKENVNRDPYSRGRELGKKTFDLSIPNPSESTPVVKKETRPANSPSGAIIATPEPQRIVQLLPEPTSQQTNLGQMLESKIEESGWNYLGLLILGVLILLALVIGVVYIEFRAPRA